jgi:integrase
MNQIERRIPNKDEVQKLLKTLKRNADAAIALKHRRAVVDHALVMTLVGSGLRSAEVCSLAVGDVDFRQSTIQVRHGKGNKSRLVSISEGLKRNLKGFIQWKTTQGESVDAGAPLFLSERREKFGTRGLRHLFKRSLVAAGLPDIYGIHALRHFHLSILYQSTKDLRLTQLQAGHSSINTTASIYTHITLQTRKDAVDKVFG